MIKFLNNNNQAPYLRFRDEYEKAFHNGQKVIQAICISSYSKNDSEVDSRFVNLKIVDDEKFIFFSNYESPKSHQFDSHNQISSLIFWSATNIQIRMKSFIKKTDEKYSDEYFKKRSPKKNALAISSKQSENIKSYESVIERYQKTLENTNLKERPKYWGGYSFEPYYFEFWSGHESRLNKREVYKRVENSWNYEILQP